jgi:glycosyltransferase involved in cell wall biosynthesis
MNEVKGMRKTICMVGSGVVSIPPKFGGGIEIFIYEISKFISKKMNSIVIDRKEAHEKNEEICEGVKFYKIEAPKFKNIFLSRITEFMFGLNALKKIRMIKPDIIHLHTVFTGLPFAIFRFLLPKNSELIYTCHNPAWTVPDNELDKFNLLIEKVEHFIMQKCHYITTDSKAARLCIIRKSGMSPQKIFALYNFTDTKKFSKKSKKIWRKKIGVRGPIVLFVGKLIPSKGIEYLLKSIPSVAKKFPNVNFVIVGPMSFEQEKRNIWIDTVRRLGVSKNTIFAGAVSDNDLPEIFSSADLFCFPTLRETFGIVLAEAMSAGLPVISSDLQTVKEITGGASILVKRGDINELSNAVIRLLTNKKLRKKLSAKAIARSRLFDKRKVLKTYLNFYEKCQRCLNNK